MKLWAPDDADAHFELTPMIDVVFLLIAFFMMLTNFITAELIEMDIPIAEEAKVPEEKRIRQYISIQKDGALYFGAAPVEYERLTGLLKNARAEDPGIKVYLRADAETAHRYVNRVMSACAEAGIFDLIFATNQS